MIAEHQNQHRFILSAEIFSQPQKLVFRFVNERQILFGHRINARLIHQANFRRIVLDSVRAMILNGDVKQK